MVQFITRLFVRVVAVTYLPALFACFLNKNGEIKLIITVK